MHSLQLQAALLVLAVLAVITKTDGVRVAQLSLTTPAGQRMKTQPPSKPTRALTLNETRSGIFSLESLNEGSWANETDPFSQPLLFTRDVFGDVLPIITDKLFSRHDYMNAPLSNQNSGNFTDYANIMSHQTHKKHPLEHKLDAYLRNPSISNHTKPHTKILMETLFNMSTALANVGLTHQCPSSHSNYFPHTLMKAIDQMLLDGNVLERSRTTARTNIKKNQQLSLKTLFRQILHTINKHKKKQCREDLYGVKDSQSYFKKLIGNLDEDLIAFLVQEISPVLSVVHNFEDGHLHLHESLQSFCTVNYKLIGENDPSPCGNKLTAIINQTGLLQNHSPRRHSSPKRLRRFSGISASTEVNRDGYGGDSHHDSANYVIIPDSGSDYSHVYLLKILVGWALGAYALLGLLAYQAYFIPHVTGLPGPQGTSGPSGDQGVKGIKGMTGPKGTKGVKVNGDPGTKGLKGVKGDTGSPGALGPPGPVVSGDMGDPGNTGTAGNTPPMGSPGNPGPAGLPGPAGDPGDAGTRRRRDVNVSRVNLLDSPILLDKMYDIRDAVQASPSSGSRSQSDYIANVVNMLWRSSQSKMGCVKCSLFQFLNDQRHIDLDSYTIAGFAHILGASESLQLLDDVRDGKRRGSKMRCRQRNNSCDLKHLGNV